MFSGGSQTYAKHSLGKKSAHGIRSKLSTCSRPSLTKRAFETVELSSLAYGHHHRQREDSTYSTYLRASFDAKKQQHQNAFSRCTEVPTAKFMYGYNAERSPPSLKPKYIPSIHHLYEVAADGSIQESRLRINVAGRSFEIALRLVERFPKTLLARKQERLKYYDARRNEYFFDRSAESFEVKR